MPDFLTDFAHAHFAASPRQALFAAVIERWEPSALLQALGSGRPQLQRIAARKLQSLRQTPEFYSAVLNGLSADDDVRVGVLTALSFLPLPLPEEPAIRIAVEENLEHASHRVREAAARVLIFQRPERASRLLPLLEGTGATDIARLLCLSDQPDLIWPLLRFYGHPERRPPPIIGMLLNPCWLAAQFATDPDAVGWLIRECGYSDAPVADGTILLLQRGFMYVSAEMSADPRPDDWRPRLLEFCWNLLPESLGIASRAACRVDLADPLDTALFLAAVRQADRSNLDELRSRDPFSHRTLESRQILVCSHAHAPYVRRQFVDGASALAEELHVGLRMDYIDDVIQTHLLAAAMLSGDPACERIVAGYIRELEDFVTTLPPAFAALLHANFYEATGDPRDAALLELLPIIRMRRDVRQQLSDTRLQSELEDRLLRIRTRFAREAETQLRSGHAGRDEPSPLTWAETGCRIALPAGLLSYSHNEYFVPSAFYSRHPSVWQ